MMTDGRMSCQYGAVESTPHAAKGSSFYNYYFPMTTSSRQLYDNYSSVSAYHQQTAPQRSVMTNLCISSPSRNGLRPIHMDRHR